MSAKVQVDIIADASRASRGFKDAESATASWEKATEEAGRRAAIILAAVGGASLWAAKQASNQEQAFGGLAAVYKDLAGPMEEWAKAQEDIGLSAVEAADGATYLGSMLKGAGYSMEDAAAQSKTLVELGADLAATYGGTANEAVQALAATMRGEYDPIERFGVSIKKADVNARLAEKGMNGLTGEALKLAEAQAAVELIMERTADAQGQAMRESDTAASTLARLKATGTNLAAEWGEAMLPVLIAIGDILGGVLDFVRQYPDATQAMTIGFVVLAAAVAGTHYGLKTYNALAGTASTISDGLTKAVERAVVKYYTLAVATDSYTASEVVATIVRNSAIGSLKDMLLPLRMITTAIWAQTRAAAANAAAWLTNPVVLIIAGIVAAIAAVVIVFKLLYDNFEPFRNFVDKIGEGLQELAGIFTDIVGPAFEELAAAFGTVFDDISAAVDDVLTSVGPPLKEFARYFGEMVSEVAERIKPFIEQMLPRLQEALASAGEAFGQIIEAVGPMLEVFGPPLVAVFVVALAAVVGFAEGFAFAIRALAQIINVTWTTIKATISTIKATIDNVAEAFNAFKSKVGEIFAAIRERIDTVVDKVRSILAKLSDAAADVGKPFQTMADKISEAFDSVKDKVTDMWKFVSDLLAKIANATPKIPGFSTPAPTPADTRVGLAASNGLAFGGSFTSSTGRWVDPVVVNQTVNITVTGTVTDPDGAARAIEQLLNRRAARAGAM